MQKTVNSTMLSSLQIDNRIKKLMRFEAEVKLMNDEIDRIKAELKASMGDRERIETDNYRLNYPFRVSRGLDQKALKKEHPEFWEMFPKVTESRPFTYSVK